MSQIFKNTLFDWVEIPAGKLTLITDDVLANNYIPKDSPQTFAIPKFAIAKYPVTNAQFRKFVDAKGYENKNWWTDAGWEKRVAEEWIEPRYWQDDNWNGDLQPVVGVSWYEAIAFCKWLSEATSDNIMLPTEQQWQRAAQALPDGRNSGYIYSWGNDWNCEYCNNSVNPCDSNVTTPVTHYEDKNKCISPCGVVDMVGNVWEWCKTAFYTGSEDVSGPDVRVVRGGSWRLNNTSFFRVDFRNGVNPNYGNFNGGFRFARS